MTLLRTHYYNIFFHFDVQKLNFLFPEIVTDHVDCLIENGIQTRNGTVIEADIVVCATGLTLQHNFPMSTIQVDVDGVVYDAPEHYIYRG